MKRINKYFLFICLSLLITLPCFSQKYTLRDQEEIAYQAQLTLSMYQDLLNVISYSGLATESEIKELIRNSYTDSRSQIFYSDAAIIEDNIKPSNLAAQHKQDKTVKDYLHYFDLAYQKSDQQTVDFSNFEASHLKFSKYLYIKVKYTSHFKGTHKEDPAPYKAVDRLAEFRVEKKRGEWKVLITSIVYYDPKNPIGSAKDDVALEETGSDRGSFSHLSEEVNKRNAGSNKGIDQPEKFTAQKKEQDSIFYTHLQTGKIALAAEKLDEAFVAFSEAEKIYPLNQDLRISLMELAKAQNSKISRVEYSFENLKLSGDKALAARDYTKAKSLYADALRLRPEEDKLKVEIEKLGRIIQEIALLESKYAVGEYKEAIKEYNKAIRKNRNNPDYYYGRGKTYEKLNAYNEAFQDYSKAIELDGNFIEALSSRARLYTETGKYHQAIADYSLILSNPDYASAFYPERARVKNVMGNAVGAIEDYNAAIREDPYNADHHYEKGMIFLSLKKAREAVNSFSEALKNDQQHVEAIFQRGFAHAALGNLQAASNDFERAKAMGLDEGKEGEINKLTLNYYAKAEGAMAENKYTHALESFKAALLISPDFGRAWLRAGDAFLKLEEYDSALFHYDKAVEYDPISFAYFKRGLGKMKKGDEQSAHLDFKRYIPIGRELIARTTNEKKQSESKASLQSFFEEERADVLYTLGYAQLMTNQFVEALENLDMAIHSRKFFPEAYFARGSALFALEDYRRAVKNMEESIRMGLSEPLVFYSLGRAYVANGQLKDAVFSYSHALELDPQDEATYKERALCYSRLDQHSLALDDINAALSLNEALENDVELMTRKGLLELYLYKLREANQSFDQALGLEENNAWALYGKACALAQEQKLEESLEMYKKAFKTRQIDWSSIKNDPLINPISKQKRFKELVKTYL